MLTLLRETDTVVYTIGLGANVDRAALEQIAERSGGLALFPAEAEALDGEYRRVVEELRRRYVVAYTSTNPARNGAWREVSIGTKAPGVSIRSASGYFAPRSRTPLPNKGR